MEQLTEILRQATGAICNDYFLLPIHGADPVYRERVYCYELYHQMRLLWPANSSYRLNGEVDKSAHPYFQELGAGKPKPDLLVHQPGTGRYNHAVIEVKSVAGQGHPERPRRLGYERAVFLIYGVGAADALAKIRSCAAGVAHLAVIELWVHPAPTCRAEICHTLTSQR
jgi:hypothetical protein